MVSATRLGMSLKVALAMWRTIVRRVARGGETRLSACNFDWLGTISSTITLSSSPALADAVRRSFFVGLQWR
jgi:hypothetical protein